MNNLSTNNIVSKLANYSKDICKKIIPYYEPKSNTAKLITERIQRYEHYQDSTFYEMNSWFYLRKVSGISKHCRKCKGGRKLINKQYSKEINNEYWYYNNRRRYDRLQRELEIETYNIFSDSE